MRVEQANVLIFDSGVGGLSVYQEICTLLPQVNYFYLFDNEAYPYGELAQEILLGRVIHLVQEAVSRWQIDLVVIACNTASTIVLPQLRECLDIPIVGVVPAIKPAALVAQKGIALIATPATITRPYTQDLIEQFLPNVSIELLGSTRLVDIAEEKLRGLPVNLNELKTILTPIMGCVDVAVLGCTHFPLLKQEIADALSETVTLIDSGSAIARRVVSLLSPIIKSAQLGERVIHSTMPPWEADALNRQLNLLGFKLPCALFKTQI
ncbi:glutamate racemase [Vibrio sp. SM6]|uniref:Glutamate racemase n=1 Tax=Vibrio agarilyticus TaxID=2726741 RepID=A0A7X8TRU3_9VIBR|nr:glutamate racemase [Vibrio agarilyticus]